MPTLHVTTREVVLDVVVTDAHGTPVTDLPREEFTVLEDGAEQRIRSFDAPAAHGLPPGVAVHSSTDLAHAGDSPVNILVLDELNTPFEDSAYSRYSLEHFLQAQPETMPATALLAVNEKSFTVLVDYTQDRKALLAALHRDPVQYPWRLSRDGNSGPGAVVRLAETLTTLNEIAQASLGIHGRKNIVWVGVGFPSIDLTGMEDSAATSLRVAVHHSTDLLLQARATLSLIDPRPLSSATYDTETPADLATLEDETGTEPFGDAVRLSTLALTTGGGVYKARNDLDHEVAEAARNGSQYYTLVYSPTDKTAAPGDYRHVHVTVGRPGLSVTTRDGYFVEPEPGSAETAGAAPKSSDALDFASAGLSKMPYTALPLRAGGGTQGRYSLALSNHALSWAEAKGGGEDVHVALLALCFSAKGKVLAHTTEERTLHDAAMPSPTGEQVLTMVLTPPQGTTRIRFVARDLPTGRMGSADLQIP